MKWLSLSLFAALLLVTTDVFFAQESTGKPDKFNEAMKLFDSIPQEAEKQLSDIKGPSAKVFRAYLYYIKKVDVPNRTALIDSLMNQAIAESRDLGDLGEIEEPQKYHYDSLELLLRHMRFITDVAGSPPIPASIFRYYPVAAFAAFSPYWGSTRDGFLDVEDYSQYDVKKIREVLDFDKVLNELYGDTSGRCAGTIEHMYHRKQALAMMRASLGPTMFLSGTKSANSYMDADLSSFMEVWSNEQLWNKQKFNEYMLLKGRAQKALQSYYAKRLQIAEDKAAECSKNVVEQLAVAYLSQYSHSTMKDTRARPVYIACTKHGASAGELEKQLAGKQLGDDDLIDGLKYCILNDGDVSAIDWLLSKGAHLTGAVEPALFTAVRRPEIVARLIKAGADVNVVNTVGKTALFEACHFDCLESVKQLIEAGAKINQTMVAVDSPSSEEANSSCAYNYNVGSRTPLHYASMFASAPLIEYLLNKGADGGAKDSSGATADTMLKDNKNLSRAEVDRLSDLLKHHRLDASTATPTSSK